MLVEYDTDNQRWEAVLKRDRAAGNAFVYTVRSTGIYCRPTCPARVARRANVGFHKHASEAAALGFRPCKRCKPEIAAGQPDDAAVMAVKNFIAVESGSQRQQTLKQMADQAGLSKWHFHRTFTKVAGMTPGEWAKAQQQSPVASASSVTDSPLLEAFPTLDFRSYSPDDTVSPVSPMTPMNTDELFDPVPSFPIGEEDWVNMVDFDAIYDSAQWDAFDV